MNLNTMFYRSRSVSKYYYSLLGNSLYFKDTMKH